TTQPNIRIRTSVACRVAEIVQLTAPFFGRRNSHLQSRDRIEASVAHTEWSENILLGKLIESHSTHAMNDLAEGDEVDVAVHESSAGRCAQRFFDQSFDGLIVADPLFA